jgi:hypothetical protein
MRLLVYCFLIFSVFSSNNALASLITSEQSAVFRFETNFAEPQPLIAFSYSCDTCPLFDPVTFLGIGASFNISIGSEIGLSDLGNFVVTNPANRLINSFNTLFNFGNAFGPAEDVNGTFFATINRIDDDFQVETFSLFFDTLPNSTVFQRFDGVFVGKINPNSINQVSAPSTLAILLSAFIFLIWVRRTV